MKHSFKHQYSTQKLQTWHKKSKMATSCGGFDCIIIGAGIVGCSTAYQLAKRGCKTLLLEQFPLPHTRGSSHGHSRILRYVHPELIMVDMMKESFEMWKQLESETQTKIFKQTGLLLIDKKSPSQETKVWDKAFTSFDIPHESLTSRQMCSRYRGIQFHDNYKVTLEKLAGTLAADKALLCYQTLFLKHGGTLKDSEKVLSIIPGRKVIVKTTQGTYVAKRLILTPGAWAAQLMLLLGLKLPLTVERLNVCYWGEKVNGTYSSLPTFADLTVPHPDDPEKRTVIYGLPSDEYPGLMKICLHYGMVTSDPDGRDKLENCNAKDIDIISKYIQEHFPGLDDIPHIIEPCLYTNSSDHVLIIDKHPTFANIAFACGMSGIGFKFAPVYGKILTQLILGEHVDYDLSAFHYDRFNTGGGITSKL